MGRVLTVINVAKLMGEEKANPKALCRIAVMREPAHHIGFALPGEGNIINLEVQENETGEGEGKQVEFIKGIARSNGNLYNVLSTTGVLDFCQKEIWDSFKIDNSREH